MIRTIIDTYHRTSSEPVTHIAEHSDARDALNYISGYCEHRFIEKLTIEFIKPNTEACCLCWQSINTEHDLFERGENGSLYCNKCRKD